MEVSIPLTETATSPKLHTVYVITVQIHGKSITLKKRFSEFLSLHKQLTESTGSPPPISLPSKSYLFSSTNNTRLIEDRRTALETYLRHVSQGVNSQWRSSAVFQAFLKLPSELPATNRKSLDQITEPVAWLSAFRETRNMLHDARTQLSKQSSAESTNDIHSASAAAKRILVMTSSNFQQLEIGLRFFEKNKVLGAGEVRRRRDLVGNLRQEWDGLDKLATSTKLRAATVQDTASIAHKDQLFAGYQASRRILGGATETVRTKELDNQNLVELQQQVMADQDNSLVDFAKIIRRQKELGLTIGQELEEQNQLLEELDQSVDQTSNKMKIADKKLKKIY